MVLLAVAEDRKRWLLQHPLDLLIVVATPPFLPSSLQAARLLRLVRAVRVVRLAPAMKVVLSLDGLRYAAMLAVIAALGGGAAFASVEHTTTWIGVWWAIVTYDDGWLWRSACYDGRGSSYRDLFDAFGDWARCASHRRGRPAFLGL